MINKKRGFNSTKVLISGDIIEAFFYKKRFEYADRTSEQNKAFSLWRSRTTLKRLVNMNAGKWYDFERKRWFLPQFVTLTFASNQVDVKAANYEYLLFIKKLNTAFGFKRATLKYSAVIEFQDRGSIHYHVIFYNLPYIEHHIRFLKQVWSWGNVMPKSLYNIADIGNYLTKYMQKGFDDARLFNKKRYWNSRKLLKPQVFTDFDAYTFDVLEELRLKPFFSDFEDEHMIYKAWWLKHPKNKGVKMPISVVELSTVKAFDNGNQPRLL
jgi:hypothetical protein